LASIDSAAITRPSQTKEWPFVSVVVPTRNRAPSLKQLLEALAAQVYPSDRLEVIVVDNSSIDNTEAVVDEANSWGVFPVRYLRKQDDGPAASRNRGAEMASGEIIAFTDSDCIPTPAWLRSGVSSFADGVGVVCGPIEPTWVTGDQPFFSHQIHRVNREDGLYPTANVFYRREAFLDLGGFIEEMRTYSWGQPVGGDDTEMAWRVRRAGYASVFSDGATVYHQPTPITAKSYLLQPIAAQVIPQLIRSIPELRDTCLYKRYFIHRESATFALLLLGLALTRATPWAALLAAPWLQSVWPALKIDAWPPKRWGRAALRLALKFEGSALLTLALGYSSAKHRRLVL
jgi:glycosyltransferase involved in cell wall biosynthesis